MPAYKNSTSTVINAEGVRIEPGQTVETYQYIASLPAGVTLTSASPYWDNIVSSAKLTSTTTVTVPSSLLGNYKIKIYVGAGECTVKTNSSSATAQYVGLYETLELTCLSRIIDNVIVTIASCTCYVTIEKI